MSLLKALNSERDSYKSEINQIKSFIKDTEKSLDRSFTKKSNQKFSDDDKKHLDIIIEILSDIMDGKPTQGLNFAVSKKLSRLLTLSFTTATHKTFLYNMALSYLISYQEAFIKDYIYQILLHKKNMLKSKVNISYEDLLNFSSFKALIAGLAQGEVDKIGYGSIDEVHKYFDKKLSIDLKEFTDWEILREANYRRNIIIHNKAKTNKAYCKMTGYKIENKIQKRGQANNV